MLGGLARRVAFIENLRAAGNPVLVADSGDLFFTMRITLPVERALAKARLIGRGLRQMGAAAVNVGDLDLIHGLDFLRSEAAQGTPLISANLLDASTQNPLFPPYLIRQVSGFRVAFFGLLSLQFDPETRGRIEKMVGDNIVIKNPIDTAREILPKLRGQADLIVLLSDLGGVQDRELAKAVPGIDFIFGGHDGHGFAEPISAGKTYFLQSYSKGMYVGKLKANIKERGLHFEDAGRVLRLKEQLHTLDQQILSLQKATEEYAERNFQTSIERLKQRKTQIQQEIQRAPAGSEGKGNSFLWTLIALDASLKEADDVRKWIGEAGIDMD